MEAFLQRQSQDYFDSTREEIAFDLNVPIEQLPELVMSDFLHSPALRNRNAFETCLFFIINSLLVSWAPAATQDLDIYYASPGQEQSVVRHACSIP